MAEIYPYPNAPYIAMPDYDSDDDFWLIFDGEYYHSIGLTEKEAKETVDKLNEAVYGDYGD